MSRSFSLRFHSMHVFDCLAYTVNTEITKSLKMKRQLCPDAVPTIDSIVYRVFGIVGWYVKFIPITIFFLYDCKHNNELHIKCCFEMLFVVFNRRCSSPESVCKFSLAAPQSSLLELSSLLLLDKLMFIHEYT